MSGGVDSSVAAALLLKKGFDVVGVFMHFWSEPGFEGAQNTCCSLESLEDARKVAQKLNISLYTLNFDRKFKLEIVDDFIKQYKEGFTPNPCVRCNKYIKFGLLLEKARKMGADYLATGHYARIKEKNGAYRLYKGKDKEKDQSYFLYNLTQEQLRYLKFPLGKYKKEKVRKLAKKFGLPVHSRKESQEVCFIPEKDHREFLKRHLKLKSGPILTIDGQKIGEHKGLPLYTLGQRKTIDVGPGGPYFVVDKDFKNNALIVAPKRKEKVLFKKELKAHKVNWVRGYEPKLPIKIKARIRYRSKDSEAEVLKRGSKTISVLPFAKSGNYLVRFKKAQRAVTPGQSVVFYKGDELIGGGIIIK